MAVTGVNGRYIKHDTALDGAGTTYPVRISKIIWYGFTNGAHTLQVEDGSGNIIIPAFACGAAVTVIGPIELDFTAKPLSMEGVETAVLGSGTVIYLLA